MNTFSNPCHVSVVENAVEDFARYSDRVCGSNENKKIFLSILVLTFVVAFITHWKCVMARPRNSNGVAVVLGNGGVLSDEKDSS